MSTEHVKENELEKLLSCHPSNKENFYQLARLMKRGVVIPFIGAGFSMNFGYQGWSDFLKEQAKELKLPQIAMKVEKNEYENAASILKNNLQGNIFEYLMLREFDSRIYKGASPAKELDALPILFKNLMITTNFDEVLEMLYAKVNGEYIAKVTPNSIQNANLIYRRIAYGEPTLIKLHGDVALREFVLTKESYDKCYGKNIPDLRLPVPSFLKDILLSRVLLFLGCSLEQDRTLKIIEAVQNEGGISFALLPLLEGTENPNDVWNPILTKDKGDQKVEIDQFKNRKDFLHEHNIIPIWYPKGKGAEAVRIFLTGLMELVMPVLSFSTTELRRRVDSLIKEDERIDHGRIYGNYMEAEEIMRKNSFQFDDSYNIKILRKIKSFYSNHGYIYERKELVMDLLASIRRAYGEVSIEMCEGYHDLGYTFERYQYYRLMLQTMKHGVELFEEYKLINKDNEKKEEKEKEIFNAAAYFYTSLAYAYLQNGDKESAKDYYKKVEDIKDNHLVRRANRAFIYNGLNRYYMLLGNSAMALDSLDAALKIRRELRDEEDGSLTAHIINTHSNKIQIYLKLGLVDEANKEYQSCIEEPRIQNQQKINPSSNRRILSDYGDILAREKKYKEAVEQYQKALDVRKYVRVEDDRIAASTYRKMAECLAHDNDQREEALEYYIQSLLVYRILPRAEKEISQLEAKIEELSTALGYTQVSIEQRIEAQRNVKAFRLDSKIQEREDELIQYFGLA